MPASSKHERPIFVLALRPEPRVDGIRALRGALKVLKRRFGLRAVTIREHHAADAGIDRSAIKNRYGHGRERVTRAPRRLSGAGRRNAESAPPVY
jgi:hypothetical protein